MKQLTIYLLLITTVIAGCSSCKKETTPEFYYNCKLNGQDYTYYACANCLQCNILGDSVFILAASTDYKSVAVWHNDTKNGISIGNYVLSNSKNPGGGDFTIINLIFQITIILTLRTMVS